MEKHGGEAGGDVRRGRNAGLREKKALMDSKGTDYLPKTSEKD
jgi:hypothetical protein